MLERGGAPPGAAPEPLIGVPLAPLTKTAFRDLWDGFRRPDLWGRLGWLEIKRRYRQYFGT